jgi:hypothetical protein
MLSAAGRLQDADQIVKICRDRRDTELSQRSEMQVRPISARPGYSRPSVTGIVESGLPDEWLRSGVSWIGSWRHRQGLQQPDQPRLSHL